MSPPQRIAVVVFTALSIGAARQDRFTGVISDDMCARNHASMRMGPTDGECARACVLEHDGEYVLVSESAVYKLSDQKSPARFAGQRVTVTGKLDRGTIQVESLAAEK